MAGLFCKICGGLLPDPQGRSVVQCEYCDNQQTVPLAEDERKLNLFAMANTRRRENRFDEAAVLYAAIAAEYPQEAECYWGMVLCRYGIEYVDDPATGKKIPTCHRSSFESVLEDPDYEMAMEFAEPEARRVYRAEAKALETIREGILEISTQEAPYDIFICYKETDEESRQRTMDSLLAQDLYQKLTEAGYRVFFSRITLESKLGVQYEPYIFAALNSARVMLTVGTRRENLEAPWVRNEWSRFLRIMAKDRAKRLIPCYRDLDPARELPGEFAGLQGQDLGKIGAAGDLLRVIHEIMGRDVPGTATAAVPAAADSWQNMLADAFWDVERGKSNLALDVFRQAISQEGGRCPEAYLGMSLVCDSKEVAGYVHQFGRVAGDTMSPLEKSIYTPKLQDKLLQRYAGLRNLRRLEEALRAYSGQVPQDTLVEVFLSFPTEQSLTLLRRYGLTLSAKKRQTFKGGAVGEKPLLNYYIGKEADPETIRLLLANGADPCSIRTYQNNHGTSRYSALGDCVRNKVDQEDLAKELIRRGADVNHVEQFFYESGKYGERPLLSLAVIKNKPELVKAMIAAGADVNRKRLVRDENGDNWYSPIYDSLVNGKNPELTRILLENGADPKGICTFYYESGGYGELPELSCAVQEKLPDAVELLLRAGADPNGTRLIREVQGDSHYPALYDSIRGGKDPRILQALLAAGADPGIVAKVRFDDGSYSEKPMIFYAITQENPVYLQLLLEKGADPNQTRMDRENGRESYALALKQCLGEKNDLEMAKILISAGAQVDGVSVIVDKDGDISQVTALHEAVRSKNHAALELLIASGADASKARVLKDQFGENVYPPLSDAIWRSKDLRCAEMLLCAGADPNAASIAFFDKGVREEKTMLYQAVDEKDVPMVKLLLAHGANPNSRMKSRHSYGPGSTTALYAAVDHEDTALAAALLDGGADVDERTQKSFSDNTFGDRTPLNEAVRLDNMAMARLLLERGADPNAPRIYRNDDSQAEHPPLHESIWNTKSLEMARLLLKYKADPNLPRKGYNAYGEYCYTPLNDAVWEAKWPEMTKLLLENGANPNSRCQAYFEDGVYEDRSVLSEAAVRGNKQCVEVLLKHGADPDSELMRRNRFGDNHFSALSEAIWNSKNLEVVELLLRHGAKANRQETEYGDDGVVQLNCMLFYAIKYAQSVPLINLLVKYGASMNDQVTYAGKKIPLKRYPFTETGRMLEVLKWHGWKGPGFFDRF